MRKLGVAVAGLSLLVAMSATLAPNAFAIAASGKTNATWTLQSVTLTCTPDINSQAYNTIVLNLTTFHAGWGPQNKPVTLAEPRPMACYVGDNAYCTWRLGIVAS